MFDRAATACFADQSAVSFVLERRFQELYWERLRAAGRQTPGRLHFWCASERARPLTRRGSLIENGVVHLGIDFCVARIDEVVLIAVGNEVFVRRKKMWCRAFVDHERHLRFWRRS